MGARRATVLQRTRAARRAMGDADARRPDVGVGRQTHSRLDGVQLRAFASHDCHGADAVGHGSSFVHVHVRRKHGRVIRVVGVQAPRPHATVARRLIALAGHAFGGLVVGFDAFRISHFERERVAPRLLLRRDVARVIARPLRLLLATRGTRRGFTASLAGATICHF